MATLTLKNVPDDLYAALKESAKRNRRSLNQEVIAELAERRQPPKVDRDPAFERARAGREAFEGRIWATPQQIDRFINEGRDRRDLMLAAALSRSPGHRDLAGERVSANRQRRGISVDHEEIDGLIERGRR
jgi:plasmid stability protein